MFELSAVGKWIFTVIVMLTGMTTFASGKGESWRFHQSTAIELYSYALSFTPLALLGYMLYLVSMIQ